MWMRHVCGQCYCCKQTQHPMCKQTPRLPAYHCCWRLLRHRRLLCPLLMAVLLNPAHVR